MPIEALSSPIPTLRTKGVTTTTWKSKARIPARPMPLTTSLSVFSKEKWDLILVHPIGSYVNDGFRDMTMADEENPHQLFKLPGPIAPAIPKHLDLLSSHQTTSATTKKPRRWCHFTKPTKEQLMNHPNEQPIWKILDFIQDFKMFTKKKKQGFVNIMKLLWDLCGTYSLSMDLSPASFQRSPSS